MTNIPCIACSPDAQPLSDAQLTEALLSLSGWQLEQRREIPMLLKRYRYADFASALAAANTIAALAETNGHHPELVVSWGQLEVRWWSHKIRAIHQLDVALAAACDQLLGG